MDIKVYNYIDQNLKTASTAATSQTESSTSSDSADFEESLALAKKAAAALAVDAAILAVKKAGQDGISLDSHLAYQLGLISTDPDPDASSSTSGSSGSTTSAGASGSWHSSTHSSASWTGTLVRSKNYTTQCPSHTGTASYDNNGTLQCSDEYEDYFEAAADETGVDVKLLKALAMTESAYKADAVSSCGAVGIMQIMPTTMEAYGIEDGYDPYENILGGARILADKLEEFDGDLSLALAAYNAGSGAVKKYGGIPPYTETQNYVKKVTAYYNS